MDCRGVLRARGGCSGDMDCRGVLRGGCSDCGCDEYDGGEEGKKCVGCGHVPAKHKSLSSSAELPRSQIIQNCPSSPPGQLGVSVQHYSGDRALSAEVMLAPDQRCIYKGCTRKRWKDGKKIHEFCGITHAHRHKNESILCDPSNPMTLCKTPGCKNPRREKENSNGEYFDYCSLYCRDNQQKEGQAMIAPAMQEECTLPGCTRYRYQDPANGRIHDFCSRTHAAQASKSDEITITMASGQEVTMVTKKFKETWSHQKGQCPAVDYVFSVSNTILRKRWKDYRDNLPSSVTEEYFHGTKLVCDIMNTNSLCNDVECGICGIANIGFDRRCIRKNIDFQRFGHGFYLAPNSSKCHDYTQGSCGYRAMLLFDVCPGNKYQLQRNDEKLTEPPDGYHSVHGKSGIRLNYDELVLYDPDGALPKFVVVYSKDGDRKIA